MNKTSKNIAVIIGNTGGIGKSIFEAVEKKKNYSNTFGFNKKKDPIINICSEESIMEIAKNISYEKKKIGLLFIATGFLHDNVKFPEKKIGDINTDFIQKNFLINTIGIALMLKNFGPLMDHNTQSLVVCLSARVGSIEDNYLGGWYSYRASKAALNQIIKTAAIEYKRKKSLLTLISMHPGTVKTKLSQPFANPNRKMFSTDEAAEKILKTLSEVDLTYSGKLIDYDGKIIPY